MDKRAVVRNHGYLFLLYPIDSKQPPRAFGPFRTPAEALENSAKFVQSRIDCDKPERPKLNQRYGFKRKMDYWAYVSLMVLENLQFEGLKKV